jgi:membrane fusion protein (multidrug efflux system)
MAGGAGADETSDDRGEGAPEKGSDQSGANQGGDRDATPHAPKKGLKERPGLIITGVVLLLVAILGGLLFWLHARNYQSTDDAFVDAHIVRLAPQVPGRVVQVLVNDNQQVAAGQLLIVLDSADAQTEVAQAQAQAAQAQAQFDNAKVQIGINRAGYQQALADLAAAEALADNAARNLARYRVLQATNPAAVAGQQIDQAEAEARQSAAQRDAAAKAVTAKAEQVKASITQASSGEDEVRAAQSRLNAANINLGYNQIVAPIAGHVAQKTVALGNYAQAGTQLLAVVPRTITGLPVPMSPPPAAVYRNAQAQLLSNNRHMLLS